MPLTFGLSIAMLMRPHYALAYLLLLSVTLLVVKATPHLRHRASVSHWIAGAICCGAFASGVLWATYGSWADSFLATMEKAQDYFFLYDANSNRYYIEWTNASDYFRDIWWGVPVSIIGPTFSESMDRVYFVPVFIEGVVSLSMIFYLAWKLLGFSTRYANLRPIVCFGFFPALAIALAAHYLLGVFNPGSAIRYKQSLAPLFYFYPLLLMAEVKRKAAMSRSNIPRVL
jgi:hypothetical protein